MTDETQRAAFEAWAAKNKVDGFDYPFDVARADEFGQGDRLTYCERNTRKAWACWQAATAQATAPLEAAIKKVHTAKGRHHNQIAMCDLYELVGLPCVRPEAIRKGEA